MNNNTIEKKEEWDDLWATVEKQRKALESSVRGETSDERRKELEDVYSAAHKQWWDAVSAKG